jgi:hypothetical protein
MDRYGEHVTIWKCLLNADDCEGCSAYFDASHELLKCACLKNSHCGKVYNRAHSQCSPDLTKSQVLHPEVVAPLADAVRLIDGKHLRSQHTWRRRHTISGGSMSTSDTHIQRTDKAMHISTVCSNMPHQQSWSLVQAHQAGAPISQLFRGQIDEVKRAGQYVPLQSIGVASLQVQV